jgi:hypothetical protein
MQKYYRLSSTGSSSSKYGNCEWCKKHASEIFIGSFCHEFRSASGPKGHIGYAEDGISFAHEECIHAKARMLGAILKTREELEAMAGRKVTVTVGRRVFRLKSREVREPIAEALTGWAFTVWNECDLAVPAFKDTIIYPSPQAALEAAKRWVEEHQNV